MLDLVVHLRQLHHHRLQLSAAPLLRPHLLYHLQELVLHLLRQCHLEDLVGHHRRLRRHCLLLELVHRRPHRFLQWADHRRLLEVLLLHPRWHSQL
jgi:hypothetical protein